MMLTEWGKQLDKSCPLSEYPRPQFVRDSYLSLNGMWQCAFTRDSTVPVQMDTAICVPFSPETPLSGVERTLKPGEYLHYRRTFALPENFNRGRVFLHFGAVDQMCTVYLNGVQVGGHQGGYTPFTLELTEALQPGENKLEVSAGLYGRKPVFPGKTKDQAWRYLVFAPKRHLAERLAGVHAGGIPGEGADHAEL